MDVMEKVENTELIGRDFLVWLWFKSETRNRAFSLGEGGVVEISFDGKITLETDIDEGTESVTCGGEGSRLKEARYALARNKKVTKAGIKLVTDDEEYRFTLDSRWMNYRSLKTPRIMHDDEDDPEGMFYEKAGLIEKAVSIMDRIFIEFIRLRLSEEWEEKELPEMINWIGNYNN